MKHLPWRNPETERRCGQKHGFREEGRAMRVAFKLQEKTGELIVAYQCPDCMAFHVGHAPPSAVQETTRNKARKIAKVIPPRPKAEPMPSSDGKLQCACGCGGILEGEQTTYVNRAHARKLLKRWKAKHAGMK